MFDKEKESLNTHIHTGSERLIIVKGIYRVGKTPFITEWKEMREEENGSERHRIIIYFQESETGNFEDLVSKINESLMSNNDLTRLGILSDGTHHSDPIEKFKEIMKAVKESRDLDLSLCIIMDEIEKSISEGDIDKLRGIAAMDLPSCVYIIIVLSPKYGFRLDRLSNARVRIKCRGKGEIKEMWRTVPDELLMKIYKICRGHLGFIEKCIKFITENDNFHMNDSEFEDMLLDKVMKPEFGDALSVIQKEFFEKNYKEKWEKWGERFDKVSDSWRRLLLNFFKCFLTCEQEITCEQEMEDEEGDFGGIDEKCTTDDVFRFIFDLLKKNEAFCKYLEKEEAADCVKLYPPLVKCICEYIENSANTSPSDHNVDCFCCN